MFQRWYGEKLVLSHLKVFGCVAYAHVTDEVRHKLGDKAERLAFIGYSTQSKVFRLCYPRKHKVVVRRDVVCEETKFGTDELVVASQTIPKNQEKARDPNFNAKLRQC